MSVTNTLLTYLRQEIIDRVDHAQYRIGDGWIKAAVNEKRINGDGTVTIGFYITATSGTVTACRIRDKANNVLASRTESIVLEDGSQDIYYFFTYRVYELEQSGGG